MVLLFFYVSPIFSNLLQWTCLILIIRQVLLEISGTCGLMLEASKLIVTSRPFTCSFHGPRFFFLWMFPSLSLWFSWNVALHREAMTRGRFCGAWGLYNLEVSLKGIRNHKYKFILKSEYLFKIRGSILKNNKFKNVTSTVNTALLVPFPYILWLYTFFKKIEI